MSDKEQGIVFFAAFLVFLLFVVLIHDLAQVLPPISELLK